MKDQAKKELKDIDEMIYERPDINRYSSKKKLI